jgi:hypothetical protein
VLSEQEKEELKAEEIAQPRVFAWIRSDMSKRERKIHGGRWLDITIGSNEEDPSKWTSVALRRFAETGKVWLLVDHKKIKKIE